MAEHHSSGNTANHGIYRQQVAPILAAAQQHLRRGGTTTGETHSQRGRPRGGPLASLSSSGSNSRRPSTAASNSSSAGTSSSSSGMMRFVEGFVSPFVQCWQPPLNACAGMELKLPNHNTGSRYACGGDIAGCADEVMPTVCGSGGGVAVATTRSNRGRSRMSFSSRSPVPVPVQTTSTMVTPTASSVAPPNHRPIYPRTTPPIVRHPPHVIQNLAPAPTNNNGSTAAQQQHQPCATDVLCGRGGSSNRHNVHFRELVAANKAIYTTLTKKQKMLLSRKVVETIHQAGGRFLAKDATTGEWQDIGLPRSWEKASQALREKTSNASNTNSNNINNTNRKGKENIELMVGSEQGASDNVDSSSTQNKVHPRLAEAPPLTIPGHLQEIYRAKTFTTSTSSAVAKTPAVIGSNTSSHPGWAAEFPPTDQSWVADFSPRPDPTESAYGYQQHHYPSEWAQSMPAPHRGAHPFSSRQMSRLDRKQFGNNSHKPSMVSPHNLSNLHTHSGTSWHQSPIPTYNTNSAAAMMTTPRHHSQNHGDRHPSSPDPGYTNHGGNNNRHTTLPVVQGATTIAVTPVRPTSTSDDNQQSDKRGGRSPEMKRQRTHEEGEETRDEEDVILFDDPHHHSGSEATFSLQNTSLTDGSHQLPAEVESKLSLQDKVISPSGLLQDRSAPRRPFAPSSPTTTSTSTNNVSKRLNTSAEEEGLAGLVALSSATFLRMDES